MPSTIPVIIFPGNSVNVLVIEFFKLLKVSLIDSNNFSIGFFSFLGSSLSASNCPGASPAE